MAHNGFQERSIIICDKCNSISFSTSSCCATYSMNIAAEKDKEIKFKIPNNGTLKYDKYARVTRKVKITNETFRR